MREWQIGAAHQDEPGCLDGPGNVAVVAHRATDVPVKRADGGRVVCRAAALSGTGPGPVPSRAAWPEPLTLSYAPRCEVAAAPQTDLRDGITAGARGVAGLPAGPVLSLPFNLLVLAWP